MTRRSPPAAAVLLCFTITAPAAELAVDDYDAALATLLPLQRSGDPFSPDVAWRLQMRIVPSFKNELFVRLTRSWTGAVSMETVSGHGQPIQEQLRALRARDPNARLEKLLEAIKVDRTSTDDGRCPQLRSVVAKAQNWKLPIAISTDLLLDATTYELLFETRTGYLHAELPHVDAEAVPWINEVIKLAQEGCPSR